MYKLLRLNNIKKTGCHCDLLIYDKHDYVHLVGKVSEPPLKKLSNKKRFDLSRNIHNVKDKKSLHELAIVAEFRPILKESDVNILLNKLFVFMIQVKSKYFYFLLNILYYSDY